MAGHSTAAPGSVVLLGLLVVGSKLVSSPQPSTLPWVSKRISITDNGNDRRMGKFHLQTCMYLRELSSLMVRSRGKGLIVISTRHHLSAAELGSNGLAVVGHVKG